MTFKLPSLPYAQDALEPYISSRTISFHYGKHHRAYVDKLNAAIAGTRYETQTLEAIIESSHEAGEAGIFNNAAQVWNHTFYWNGLSPDGGGEPGGRLGASIDAAPGKVEAPAGESSSQ